MNNFDGFKYGDIIRYSSSNGIPKKYGDIIRNRVSKFNKLKNIGIQEDKKKKEEEEINKKRKVYLVESIGRYKIGSAENMNTRIRTFNTGNPFNVNYITSKEFEDGYKKEKEMHKKYKQYRIPGKQEWYIFPEQIVEQIKKELT